MLELLNNDQVSADSVSQLCRLLTVDSKAGFTILAAADGGASEAR